MTDSIRWFRETNRFHEDHGQGGERFGEIIERAARGEEVVILRRGRPVALLVPARPAKPAWLPDLRDFRASIRTRGATLTEHLLKEREVTRY